MKLAVLIIGNGRGCIHDTIRSVRDHIFHPVAARLMINDAPDPEWAAQLEKTYPDYTIVHTGGIGMAGAVQAGFKLCKDYDPDFVWWNEDDMRLIRHVPVGEAAITLSNSPRLAQMCFRREPWWGSPTEMHCEDQLLAIAEQATHVETRNTHVIHDWLFSLNPCLIPAKILDYMWPSGPIGVGNEAGFTRLLLDLNYRFGSWGPLQKTDPWAVHVGHERGAGWAL